MAAIKRVFLSAIFLASYAVAAPLCTSFTTLNQYIATGSGGCQLGDKLFYSFSYGSGGTGVADTAVTVGTSITNGGLNIALTFTGNWTAAAAVGQTSQTRDVTLRFSVLAPPSAPMISTSLSMTGYINYVRPTGIIESVGKIQAGETVTGGASGSLSPAAITTSSVSPSSALQTSPSSLAFAPTTILNVSKDLTLLSGGSTSQTTANDPRYKAESVTLVSFTEGFNEVAVPEPSIFFTFGGGLLFLGLAGKRLLRVPSSATTSSAKENYKNSEAL